jgi:uncharacterized RDD family membrane protein YckC
VTRAGKTLMIRTPEGVAFALDLAGPGARMLALTMDVAMVIALTQAASYLLLILAIISADLMQAAQILAYFLISYGYRIMAEWKWRGQTVGKRAMGLRVMDEQGLKLRFSQVVIRNLMREVDFLPSFYLVGGAAMLVTRNAQRLGDFAANTVVVQTARLAEPKVEELVGGKYNSLREHPHLEARLRQLVSPREAGIAVRALMRRDQLDPQARVELFSEIAARYKSLVQFPPEAVEGLPDEQYVRNVVDILFRARR